MEIKIAATTANGMHDMLDKARNCKASTAYVRQVRDATYEAIISTSGKVVTVDIDPSHIEDVIAAMLKGCAKYKTEYDRGIGQEFIAQVEAAWDEA